jgi:hypothetical protein
LKHHGNGASSQASQEKKAERNLKRLLKSEDAFLRIMPTVNPNSSKITFSNRWHPVFQRDHQAIAAHFSYFRARRSGFASHRLPGAEAFLS